MKKLLCIILSLLTLMLPLAALGDVEPNPITPIPYDQLPEPLEGQHHYLLMCVDTWNCDPNKLGNTDGMVLVTLDTRANRVMLTTFSRDTLVLRPDGVVGRINYIAKHYSPEELCKIVSTHFGVKVEKYLLFDFKQIANIVDQLGGVYITVNNSEASYLRRYAISSTSTEPSMYREGTYLFHGHAAVIYMRIRKLSGGEFMRTQRIRTVLSTLADQCREITYDDALALVNSVVENTCLTNMSFSDLMEAMNYAMQLRGITVEELMMPPNTAYERIIYAGMDVVQVDYKAARAAMADYMVNTFLVMDDDE